MAGQRMTTYILLRKNKESGPFTLEQLQGQLILPDDLFWMEGQSVCWLNPGEIKELSGLVGQTPSSVQPEHSAYLPSTEPVPVPPAATSPLVESPPPVASKKIPVQTLPADEPEIRYEKPLDEIKALYLKNLERQQQKKHFNFRVPPLVKKLAPYAAFLVIGLLAGSQMRKKDRIIPAANTISSEKKNVPAETPSFAAEPQTNTDPIPVSRALPETRKSSPEPTAVVTEEPVPMPARERKKQRATEEPE